MHKLQRACGVTALRTTFHNGCNDLASEVCRRNVPSIGRKRKFLIRGKLHEGSLWSQVLEARIWTAYRVP